MKKLTPHQIYTSVVGGVAVSALAASVIVFASLMLV
jgi:hypothetical protein